MYKNNWIGYYQVTKNTQPRKTLLKAVDYLNSLTNVDSPPLAIDLGCGTGVDTLSLLKLGWRVLAIDAQAGAISALQTACPLQLKNKLITKLANFASLKYLPLTSLINANYSLHFIEPDYFYKFWSMILTALQPGGIFSGTFLGVEDSWNKVNKFNMTFCSTIDLDVLLNQFDIKWIEETKEEGKDALGYSKYWHIYSLVAKRN